MDEQVKTMTMIEELVQIVYTLGEDEQRRVLNLAIELREKHNHPDISLASVALDEASLRAWSERAGERSRHVLEEEKQRLMALGLIDEHWNALSDTMPADMLPTSKSSVET